MLILWVKNSLTTDDKHNLRAFKTSYIYNNQNDGAAIFFVVVKRFNLTHAKDSQTNRQICKPPGCIISNMIYPNPTYRFRNG